MCISTGQLPLFLYILINCIKTMNSYYKGYIVLLICFSSVWFSGFSQEMNFSAGLWNRIRFDDINGQTFSYADLVSIFNQVDFYDYVRTNGQKDKIIEYLLQQCKNQNYQLGIAKCNNILGVIARDRSEYAKAIELHEQALKYAGIDTITQIFSLNNLGVVYRRLDKPRLALDFHMKALSLSERFHGDLMTKNRSICVSLNSIGNINLSLNQPNKALDVFTRSLEMEEMIGNNLGTAINLQNIGLAYEMTGKLDTALIFYNQSMTFNQAIGSTVGLAICNNSIGNIYLLKKEPKKALDFFKKAMVLSDKTNDTYYISQTHANLGRTYMEMEEMDKAKVQIDSFIHLSQTIRSGLLIKESHLLFSQYYEHLNQFDVAFEFYKKAMQINDSIINEQNTRYLNELQTLYEAQQKEQQINLLLAENKIKTQQSVIAITTILIMGLTIILLLFFQQKRSAMKRFELEQRLFRSQMNPHFIFNALGSIQSFMYKNEPRKAAEYLGLYSQLTRSVLQNSNNELITLEEELDTLRNYIEIEKMRLQSTFDYQIDISDEVELDFTYIPPIILQPFVENAIHHGLRNLSDVQGFLEIKIWQKNDYLFVSISDNGPGIHHVKKEEKPIGHYSMGMKIFQQRMQLIKKKYKKSIIFAVTDLSDEDSSKSGTKIKIGFPLIYPHD